MANEVTRTNGVLSDSEWVKASESTGSANHYASRLGIDAVLAQRPKDGYTLEHVEDAVIRVCLRCGVGQAFKEELMNELAPKPKSPEERLQDISKAYTATLNQETRIKCFTELEELCGELLKEADRVPRA